MTGPDERAELLGETPERARHRTQRGRVAVGLVFLVLALAGVFSVAAATEPRSALLGNRNSIRRETDDDLGGVATEASNHGTSTLGHFSPWKFFGVGEEHAEEPIEVEEEVEEEVAKATETEDAAKDDADAAEDDARVDSSDVHLAESDAPSTAVSLDFARAAIEKVQRQRRAAVKQLKKAGVPVTEDLRKEIERAEKKPRALDADVYAIVLGGADPAKLNDSDAEKKVDVVGHLGEAFGAENVATHAHLTPAVVAAAWPEDEAFAGYALKEIKRRVSSRLGGDAEKTEAAMRDLPWINHFTKRKEDGSLDRDEHWPENFDHHVGCLFAHMLVWQLAADAVEDAAASGAEKTPRAAMVFESDGASNANLAVPFSSLQFAIDSAPADFDVLFVNKLEDPELDKRFPWVSARVDTKVDETDGVTIDFFRYRNPFAAGISGYVVSPSFLEKTHSLIADKGADMVDAWLYKLCGDSVSDADADATFLKCYAAVDRTVVEKYREEHPNGP